MNTENINLPASFRVIGVGIGIEEVIKKVKSLELDGVSAETANVFWSVNHDENLNSDEIRLSTILAGQEIRDVKESSTAAIQIVELCHTPGHPWRGSLFHQTVSHSASIKALIGVVIGCDIQHRFRAQAIKDVIKANDELLDHLFEDDD